MNKQSFLRIVFGVFVIAFFAIVSIDHVEAATGKGVVQSSSALNVRADASTSSERIGALSPGATVDIRGTKGEFYEIQFQGRQGYVHQDYIKLQSSSSTPSSKNDITIYVNDKQLDLPISKVPLENNYVLVPFRAIGEALGIDVKWIGASRQISAKDRGTEVLFTLQQEQTLVNGQVVQVSPAPRTFEQRTVIPLRFFAETFGADVKWNQATKEVRINREATVSPAAPPPSSSSGNYSGVVNRSDTLNVRSGPGQDYSSLGKLNRGDQVTISSFTDRWAKIIFNGKEAYVHSYYLDLTKNNESFRLVGQPTVTSSGKTTRVTWHKIGGVISSSDERSGQTITITTNATSIERPSSIEGVTSLTDSGRTMTLQIDSDYTATVAHTTGEVILTVSKKVKGQPLSSKTIVIDAGHGAHDPGAVGNGLNEKDIVLDVALRVETLLKQSGAHVVMTRNSDTYPTLDERAKLANDVGADIFISIHVNAAESTAANGTETFWNATYAAKDSKKLAESIHKRLIEKLGTTDRKVKEGNFQVIRTTKMSSVLLELAFVSNAGDAELLKTDQFRQNSAQAIYEGIVDYFN